MPKKRTKYKRVKAGDLCITTNDFFREFNEGGKNWGSNTGAIVLILEVVDKRSIRYEFLANYNWPHKTCFGSIYGFAKLSTATNKIAKLCL